MTEPDTPRTSALPGMARFAVAAATIVPSLALVGWALGSRTLKSLLPGAVAMNPATAIAFLLLALALWLWQRDSSTACSRLRCILAAGALFIGFTRVLGYLHIVDLGLDRLLFSARLDAEPIPNRMAPNTALGFCMLAAALLTPSVGASRRVSPAQVLALLSGALSFTVLLGYAYCVHALSRVAQAIPMAPHTAALFGLLSAGFLLSRPDQGLLRAFFKRTPTGVTGRRLLTVAFMVPAICGWLRLEGERRGFYSPEIGVAVLVVTNLILFAAAIWWNTESLDHSETAREAASAALHEANLRHLEEMKEQNAKLEEGVRERTRELAEAQVEILDRLAHLCEYRDDQTGAHTERVSELASRIAEELGLPEQQVRMIRLAAALHDLGKVAIPDDILLKPGKLTPEEFDVIKTHTSIGAQILTGGRSEVVRCAEEIARGHHERWDGRGYPQGLSGEAIPLTARIVAVADVYDALTNDRPYKRAWTGEEAADEIARQSGSQFDPQIVAALLKVLESRTASRQVRAAA